MTKSDKKFYGTTIYISKHEARAIVFWLDLLNGEWHTGSYRDIEGIYNLLSEYGGHRRKWKWLKDAKTTHFGGEP